MNDIIIGENKGAGHQMGEKQNFLGRQKFLADGVAGGSKIWPSKKNYFVWPGSSTIFYLNQKQKIYVALKLVNSKFLKNMVNERYRKEHLYLG